MKLFFVFKAKNIRLTFYLNDFRVNYVKNNDPYGQYPRPGRREKGRVADDFRDEVCLALDFPDGVAVVLGCAHPGILNMLDAVRGAFNKPLLAVFGGSHLVDADAHRLAVTVHYLKASGCGTAALGHCTGKEGAAAIAGKLACYKPLSVGALWEVI